ncbi:MAG: hypothetical protein M0Z42_09000 [Actinomycetota bacterium]|nr:hypothetical protein [Actinomycetota bacterium]
MRGSAGGGVWPAGACGGSPAWACGGSPAWACGVWWVAGVGGASMYGYHGVTKMTTDDPSQVAHHNQSQRKVVISAVSVFLIGGILTIITSYL